MAKKCRPLFPGRHREREKMKKQITCILTALALMLGLLPVTALATPESVPVTRAQLAEALYANKNLKILIDEAGKGQQAPDFSDIGPVQDGEEDPCTYRQREAILALAKAGILNGTAPGVFSPTGGVTRGEAAVVLWRVTGCKSNPIAATVSYTDVGLSDWYTPAIHALTAAGLLKGTGNNLFEPNKPVTDIIFDANGVIIVKETVNTLTPKQGGFYYYMLSSKGTGWLKWYLRVYGQ